MRIKRIRMIAWKANDELSAKKMSKEETLLALADKIKLLARAFG